ncbi:acyl-CoA thioesterase domain-containing protein [Nocardia spumae]|uniref:acyl-CoA thioesterase domain-containing protein n=1 Tax=Nocardia spumae TaxID=2887190 RepID=UPI001D15AEA8|nr:acyl-CoA thioesterase domain-containing protein [Nocardia spumae]
MDGAFFRVKHGDGEELHPEPRASSGWGANQMRGPAASAALARAVERTVAQVGRTDLRPVRWTLDLFRAVEMRPSVTEATVVRDGPRLCLIDAVLSQDGQPTARASALFLRPSEPPPGEVWSGGTSPVPPAPGQLPGGDPERLYFTDGQGWGDWTDDFRDSDRKRIWHFPIPVVDGEDPTPFQLAASVADVTNMVANLGSAGLEFINADVTMTIARLPEGMEVGLALTERAQRDGIAVGTAVMFDRAGVIGTTTVSAIANAKRAVRIDRDRD